MASFFGYSSLVNLLLVVVLVTNLGIGSFIVTVHKSYTRLVQIFCQSILWTGKIFKDIPIS